MILNNSKSWYLFCWLWASQKLAIFCWVRTSRNLLLQKFCDLPNAMPRHWKLSFFGVTMLLIGRHANGHLVIYSECCGFEGACFTLRCFFTLQSFMLFSRLPWGQQFNLIVSSASCWFSKHSNLQMGYRGRFYLCVSGLFRSKGSTNKELVTGFEPASLKVPCISSRLSWRSSHWVLWVLIDG